MTRLAPSRVAAARRLRDEVVSGGLFVVTGVAGAGKTALLDELEQVLVGDGVTVGRVRTLEDPGGDAEVWLVDVDDASEEELAALVPALRRAKVGVVVAARGPLHLDDEGRFVVAPLQPEEASAALVAEAARRGAEVAEDEALAELSRATAAWPLAVRLAGEALGWLSAAVLVERRAEWPSLLNARSREVRESHRDLAAAARASVRGLPRGGLELLDALLCFRAPARLEDLGAVAARKPDELLDDVRTLRERALVDDEGGTLSIDGLLRAALAHEHRPQQPVDGPELRHARHFAQRGRVLARDVWGPEVRAAVDEAQRARGDFFRAAEVCREAGERAAAVDALSPFEEMDLAVPSRCARLARALDELIEAGDAVARAHLARARIRLQAGELAKSAEDLARATAIGSDDPWVRTSILRYRLVAAASLGDDDEADRARDALVETAEREEDPLVRASALGELGGYALRRGDPVEAGKLLEKARAAAVRASAPLLRGQLASREAYVALTQRDLARCERWSREAVGFLEEAGLPHYLTMAEQMLSSTLFERGAIEEARALKRRMVERNRSLGRRFDECLALFDLGVLEHCAGALDDAAALFEEALTLNQAAGYVRGEAFNLAHLGAIAAQQGRRAEAERRFADAASVAKEDIAGVTSEVIQLLRGLLYVDAGALNDAEALLQEFEAATSMNEDLRYATHILIHELESARASDDSAPATSGIQLARDASFIRAEGVEASLEAHAVPRAVLRRLIDARESAPGEPVGPDALIEAAWPGEKMLPKSASNRLYVAVAFLRKHGLRPALLKRREGYWLDPGTTSVVAG